MTVNFLLTVIFGLFSLCFFFTSYLYIPWSLICNFYFAKRLRVCYYLYINSNVNLTLQKVVPNHLRNELLLYAALISAKICYIIAFRCIKDDLKLVNLQVFIITFFIWMGIFCMKKLTDSEISYLTLINNLNLGYGVAIWYYKNYLERILPANFLMRLKQFETKEDVKLPHKLYILCPKSCKVKKYIDNTDYIEYSKDLPPYNIDIGGIVDRKYSVSVYGINCNGEFFRVALEYAQPLKTLLALKENGKISLSEMYTERESFIVYLKEMLRDRENSFEVCELVEYDDETSELHDLLSDLPSVQRYKSKTLE